MRRAGNTPPHSRQSRTTWLPSRCGRISPSPLRATRPGFQPLPSAPASGARDIERAGAVHPRRVRRRRGAKKTVGKPAGTPTVEALQTNSVAQCPATQTPDRAPAGASRPEERIHTHRHRPLNLTIIPHLDRQSKNRRRRPARRSRPPPLDATDAASGTSGHLSAIGPRQVDRMLGGRAGGCGCNRRRRQSRRRRWAGRWRR